MRKNTVFTHSLQWFWIVTSLLMAVIFGSYVMLIAFSVVHSWGAGIGLGLMGGWLVFWTFQQFGVLKATKLQTEEVKIVNK